MNIAPSYELDMYRYFKKRIVYVYRAKSLASFSLIAFYCYYFLVFSLLSEEKYSSRMKLLEVIC